MIHFQLGVFLILVVAPSIFGASGHPVLSRKERQQAGLNDPARMHYVSMNHDGQYSFGYAGADSSRQERRNLDGSVEGKYSYTNPEGKLVQVEYQADALRGFNAYGENLPSRPTLPVQETQAVKDARERFMETYARELARINAAGVQKLHQAQEVPEAVVKSQVSNVVNTKSNGVPPVAVPAPAPIPPPVAVTNVLQHFDDSEVVVAAHDEPEVQNTGNANVNVPYSSGAEFEWNKKGPIQVQGSQVVAAPQGQSLYQGGGVGLTKGQQAGPAYFYYVGVGGTPYYVTSPLRTSTNIAVSVRASQLGARPIDAVHDAQVPRKSYNNGLTRNTEQTPPLYVEVGKDYQLPSSRPQFQIQFQQPQQGQQPQQLQFQQPQQVQQFTGVQNNGGFNLPFMGYPVYILQN